MELGGMERLSRKHSRLMLTFPQPPQLLQQPQLRPQQLLNQQQPKAQLLLPAMIMTIPTRARKPKMILLMRTKRMFLQPKILRLEMRMTKLAPPQSQSLLLSVSSFFLEELQLSFFFITRENFHKVSTMCSVPDGSQSTLMSKRMMKRGI